MIEFDVHGFTKDEAQREIERFIARLDSSIKEIRIIHGFHGGDALKELVRSPRGIRSKKIKRKKYTMNQGETIYELF